MKYLFDGPSRLFKNSPRPWNVIAGPLVVLLGAFLISCGIAGLLMLLPLHLPYWITALAVFILLDIAVLLYSGAFVVYALWQQGGLGEYVKGLGFFALYGITAVLAGLLLHGDIASPLPHNSVGFFLLIEGLVLIAIVSFVMSLRRIEQKARRRFLWSKPEFSELQLGQFISYHAPLRSDPLRYGFITELVSTTEMLQVLSINTDGEKAGTFKTIDKIHACQITLANRDIEEKEKAYMTAVGFALGKADESKSDYLQWNPLAEKEDGAFEMKITGLTVNPVVLELTQQEDGQFEVTQTRWAEEAQEH